MYPEVAWLVTKRGIVVQVEGQTFDPNEGEGNRQRNERGK